MVMDEPLARSVRMRNADATGEAERLATGATGGNPMKVRTNVQAGGLSIVNHNQALKVRSSVKVGGLTSVNHNQTLV